jgi:hypothetical protein
MAMSICERLVTMGSDMLATGSKFGFPSGLVSGTGDGLAYITLIPTIGD